MASRFAATAFVLAVTVCALAPRNAEAYVFTCSDFSPAVTYPSGSHANGIAVGDIDGDGKMDLVVANDGVSVLFGNGDGTFSRTVSAPAGTSPHGVAVGDFNADGRLDVAVANFMYPNGFVSVLLNNGNSTFAPAVAYPAGSVPISIATADLNADGRLDLVVANNTVPYVSSVLLGNGNGTFGSAVGYGAGASPQDAAIGDVNADGKPDLVVANWQVNNVSVLIGNGTGAFAAPVNYAVGQYPYSVAIGDVNGDGKADVAVANTFSANVSVLLGNGDGTFAAAVNHTVNSFPRSIKIRDLNGDGKPEIAMVSGEMGTLTIMPGNGNGTFASPINCVAGTGPQRMAIGDLNGDGKPDAAVTSTDNTGASVAAIFLNVSADGTYAFSNDPLSLLSPVRGVHVTELRNAANSLRARRGVAAVSFYPLVAGITPILAADITGLRAALDGVFDSLQRQRPAYTDSALSAGGLIKRVHISELRDSVRTLAVRALTTSRAGNGNGTVTSAPSGINCGSDCAENYLPETVVTLTATPASDSTFGGWSGGCMGTSTCQVTLASDASPIATFTLKRFTLTTSKSGAGSGTLTSSPAGIDCGSDCQEQYNIGTSVTITPAAASGSYFANWTGACSGSGACTVTMNADVAVGAVFNPRYTLTVTKTGTGTGTVTSSPAGIDCGSDCSEVYNSGTSVTLTAAAPAGSYFAGWTGACGGTGACAVAMYSNVSVGATFSPRYTLTTTKSGSGGGTITSSPAGISCGVDCQEAYNAGTSVTLSPSPASGSYFANWTGACSGSGACSVSMDADKTVGAVFNVQQPHTLTVTKDGSATGTVTSAPIGINCGVDCSEVYYTNDVVTLTANAPSGSYFANWTGACTGGGTCTLTMTSDVTVGATFNTFTVDIDLTRGTVRMPNKYRTGDWSVGGGYGLNWVAVPPGWSVGGGYGKNWIPVPPNWTVEGGYNAKWIAKPPGWSVGGGYNINWVAVPPGWSVGDAYGVNFVVLPPGWTQGGGYGSNFIARPPGWADGGGYLLNWYARPPGWTDGGGYLLNWVGLAPGWSVGGGYNLNWVPQPPGWTYGGGYLLNWVAHPIGWLVGGGYGQNWVAYPSSTTTTLELAYNDPGWLAWFQVLKSTGAMSDSDLADVMMYVMLGGYRRPGSAPSGMWP